MTVFNYYCPICWDELEGDFGEDVYCDNCDVTYETDWDYINDGMTGWITSKKDK